MLCNFVFAMLSGWWSNLSTHIFIWKFAVWHLTRTEWPVMSFSVSHHIQWLIFALSDSFSHRVLRHTVFICASRSLSVRATASRSNTLHGREREKEEGGGREEKNGSMLVFVDVENINTVSAFPHMDDPSFFMIMLSLLTLSGEHKHYGIRDAQIK